jgi:hypothetical protein
MRLKQKVGSTNALGLNKNSYVLTDGGAAESGQTEITTAAGTATHAVPPGEWDEPPPRLAYCPRIPFVASLAVVGSALVVKFRIAETEAFCALRQPEGIESGAGSRNPRQRDGEVHSATPQPLTHGRSPVLEALRCTREAFCWQQVRSWVPIQVFYILITGARCASLLPCPGLQRTCCRRDHRIWHR